MPAPDLDALLALDELRRVAEPLSTLLLELPRRGIGGQLPAWDDLTATVTFARVRQRRHGGDVVHLVPYVLSAKAALSKTRSHARIRGEGALFVVKVRAPR